MPEKDVFIEVLVSREKQSRESSEELIAFARGLLPGDFTPDDDFSPRIDSNIKAFIEKTPDLDTVKYNAAVLFHGVLNEDEVKALEQSGEILVWDSPSAAFP